MSGFLPAFVAIRERQRRARFLAFLLGLSYAGTALAQVPTFAPAPPPAVIAADRLPDGPRVEPAPPAVVAPPPVAPALITPPPVPSDTPVPGEPASEGDARTGGDGSASNPGSRAVPVRYTLDSGAR